MAYLKYRDYNIYYEEIGNGEPLMMLHGNSVSSKMFDYILDFYNKDFKIILIDFLGHGKSDRVDVLPTDLWYSQSQQVIALCEHKGYKKINILGSSGGALTGINVALERPDLVSKLIADSFEGTKSIEHYVGNIENERNESKKNQGAIGFWRHMHGDDWEDIVDGDTNVTIKHHREIKAFFHKNISDLEVPILMIGSKQDEYCLSISDVYKNLSSTIDNSTVHIFEEGSHPSVITCVEEFANVAKAFLMK